MPQPSELHCSDELFRSLVDAAHCSFILLAMRRLDQPLDSFEIAELLCLELLHCEDLLDTLIKFGFILPVEDGDKFDITPSGIELISAKPLQSPWKFDPTSQIEGDRLPTYVAFDLLPLRIWAYRRGLLSSGSQN